MTRYSLPHQNNIFGPFHRLSTKYSYRSTRQTNGPVHNISQAVAGRSLGTLTRGRLPENVGYDEQILSLLPPSVLRHTSMVLEHAANLVEKAERGAHPSHHHRYETVRMKQTIGEPGAGRRGKRLRDRGLESQNMHGESGLYIDSCANIRLCGPAWKVACPRRRDTCRPILLHVSLLHSHSLV